MLESKANRNFSIESTNQNQNENSIKKNLTIKMIILKTRLKQTLIIPSKGRSKRES